MLLSLLTNLWFWALMALVLALLYPYTTLVGFILARLALGEPVNLAEYWRRAPYVYSVGVPCTALFTFLVGVILRWIFTRKT